MKAIEEMTLSCNSKEGISRYKSNDVDELSIWKEIKYKEYKHYQRIEQHEGIISVRNIRYLGVDTMYHIAGRIFTKNQDKSEKRKYNIELPLDC